MPAHHFLLAFLLALTILPYFLHSLSTALRLTVICFASSSACN
eukprot:SAG22_NODE_2150_length_2929_cov_16.327208_4_plen_43_part_00